MTPQVIIVLSQPPECLERKIIIFICLIYTIQKIDLQWLWLEGEETQEATGLMGEPPCLH